MNIKSVKVSLMYGQVGVEFELTSDDDESMTTGEVKSQIDFLVEQGFTPRTFGGKAVDNIGQKGTVVKVEPVPGTKMFEVTGKMDNDTEFKWKTFERYTFREHDRFEIGKNDRGFKCGFLIIEPPTQDEMAF